MRIRGRRWTKGMDGSIRRGDERVHDCASTVGN